MEQIHNVEILVHITAPSRAADDVHYRSLASAYLDFVPCPRPEPHPPKLTPDEASRTSFLSGSSQPDPLLAAVCSPQASFGSVIDNAGSPGLFRARRPAKTPEPSGSGSGSDPRSGPSASAPQPRNHPASPLPPWQSPASVVQDSLPSNQAVLGGALSTPTRVLEHYLQQFDSQSSGSPSPLSDVAAGSPAAERDEQGPPEVPCTPPPASRESQGEASGLLAPRDDPGRLLGSFDVDAIVEETTLLSSLEEVAPTPPPPAKRLRIAKSDASVLRLPAPSQAENHGTTAAAATAATRPALLPSTSATTTTLPPLSPPPTTAALHIAFLHGSPAATSVHAPPPPVGVSPLDPATAFVTAKLAKLARDLDLERRYRPIPPPPPPALPLSSRPDDDGAGGSSRHRPLRDSERGHWRVTGCAAWTPALRRDTWAFLCNYVGSGDAGWGVWCIREGGATAAEAEAEAEADIEAKKAEAPRYSRLRVYCWGGVAPHLWLLLYLATQRAVLDTGAVWVDGGGEEVVTVPPRKKRKGGQG